LSLLGSFDLSRGGEAVDLRNKKGQALLIFLALTNRAHSREKLATLLWGNRFDDQARRSLRQCVFALRKEIGADMVEGETDLRLKLKAFSVDALELQPDAPYPGDLLDGFNSGESEFDEWLTTERTRIRTEAARMYHVHAEQLDTDGKPSDALAAAELALSLDPLDERIARFVFALLGGTGRRAEALTRYSAFAEALQAELKVEPETATQELIARIRADQGEPDLVRRDAQILAQPSSDAFHPILVAPIEDLGGGDSATFLAKDLPVQIIHDVGKLLFISINALPPMPDSDGGGSPLSQARRMGAVLLITGTTRQIGDKVRISLIAMDVVSGAVAATDNKIIQESESFEYLDTVGRIVTTMWTMCYRVNEAYDKLIIERLKLLTDQPERFLAVIWDMFGRVFFSSYTPAGMRDLETVADYAISVFPERESLHTVKGWAHCCFVDSLETPDRIAGYKQSIKYFDRALALDADYPLAVLGKASLSYWLGDFETTDRLMEEFEMLTTSMPVAEVVHGNTLIFRGKNAEGIQRLEAVIKKADGMAALENWYATKGLGHFNVGDFDTALVCAGNSLEFGSNYWVTHVVRIAALARLGRLDEAADAVADYLAIFPRATVSELDWMPFTQDAPKQAFLDALRDAGLPE
jgi:DNA-binding SARP family transcriptional activator/TolB-like protein